MMMMRGDAADDDDDDDVDVDADADDADDDDDDDDDGTRQWCFAGRKLILCIIGSGLLLFFWGKLLSY